MHSKIRVGSLLLCAALALLSACVSTGRHYGEMSESLRIDVRPNGSKLFVYRLAYPNRPDPAQARVYRAGSANPREQRGREVSPERAYRRLQDNTARALAVTEYCREGYLELDRRMARHTLWLKGECREGANEQDRKRFSGRETLTIPQPD